MAIAFRSIANTTYASRTNTTVTKPTGLTAGDLMLWAQVTATTTEAVNPTFPANWTEIAPTGYPIDVADGGFNLEMRCAYKIADADDAAATNFTASHSSSSSQGAIACWSGVDQTTPLDTTPTQNQKQGGVNGADTIATGLTTATNGACVIVWGCDWADTSNNLSAPSGTTPTFTERLDVVLMHMFEGNLTTAGATGNKTFANNADTSSPWGVFMIALRPAGAAAGLDIPIAMHHYKLMAAA